MTQECNDNNRILTSKEPCPFVYISLLLLSSFPHCLNDINGTVINKRMHTCKLLIHRKWVDEKKMFSVSEYYLDVVIVDTWFSDFYIQGYDGIYMLIHGYLVGNVMLNYKSFFQKCNSWCNKNSRVFFNKIIFFRRWCSCSVYNILSIQFFQFNLHVYMVQKWRKQVIINFN